MKSILSIHDAHRQEIEALGAEHLAAIKAIDRAGDIVRQVEELAVKYRGLYQQVTQRYYGSDSSSPNPL